MDLVGQALSRIRRGVIRAKPFLRVRQVRCGGWLSALPGVVLPPEPPAQRTIEDRARRTNDLGRQPLWAGYADVAGYPRSTTGARAPDEVRTGPPMGRFFAWLAGARQARLVVEFGTAFGVSGMYWLAGLKDGHLHTFEPNRDWAAIAAENLAAVSPAFTLTTATFESAGPGLIAPGSVDIGFIDAIHTSEFVAAQCAILMPMMRPGGLILFDDIAFSPDMADCWARLAQHPDFAAAVEVDGRVGIVELPG